MFMLGNIARLRIMSATATEAGGFFCLGRGCFKNHKDYEGTWFRNILFRLVDIHHFPTNYPAHSSLPGGLWKLHTLNFPQFNWVLSRCITKFWRTLNLFHSEAALKYQKIHLLSWLFFWPVIWFRGTKYFLFMKQTLWINILFFPLSLPFVL